MSAFRLMICRACRGLAWKVAIDGPAGSCPRCGSGDVRAQGGGFTIQIGSPIPAKITEGPSS